VQPGDKVKLLCRMNGNSVIAVKDIKSDAAAPVKDPGTPQP
jgi:hypothetical protein